MPVFAIDLVGIAAPADKGRFLCRRARRRSVRYAATVAAVKFENTSDCSYCAAGRYEWDMGELTGIEWADHTFAPWFGCMRVSPGCDLCYAEDWTVRRFHKAQWDNHPRVRKAESTWHGPLAWQRKAAAVGVRRRVFCSHYSDV